MINCWDGDLKYASVLYHADSHIACKGNQFQKTHGQETQVKCLQQLRRITDR